MSNTLTERAAFRQMVRDQAKQSKRPIREQAAKVRAEQERRRAEVLAMVCGFCDRPMSEHPMPSGLPHPVPVVRNPYMLAKAKALGFSMAGRAVA